MNDLGAILNMDVIRASHIRMGVDPLGGAGVHYWARIAERYRLDLTVVNEEIDPTFRFMTLDWDGKIRMDPSSSYAMQRLTIEGCPLTATGRGLERRNDGAYAVLQLASSCTLPATPRTTSAPPDDPRAASSKAAIPARSASRPTSTQASVQNPAISPV